MPTWFKKKSNSTKEILILGNKKAGKFALFQAIRDNDFTPDLKGHSLIDFSMPLDDTDTVLSFRVESTTLDKKELPSNPKAVLVVIDLSSDTMRTDFENYQRIVKVQYPKSQAIFVGTKHDLAPDVPLPEGLIITSAQTMEGIATIKDVFHHLVNSPRLNSGKSLGK